MPRPKQKINPKKKTYYLEAQAVARLVEMAVADGRSPSCFIERLIAAKYTEWTRAASKQKPKKTSALVKKNLVAPARKTPIHNDNGASVHPPRK